MIFVVHFKECHLQSLTLKDLQDLQVSNVYVAAQGHDQLYIGGRSSSQLLAGILYWRDYGMRVDISCASDGP